MSQWLDGAGRGTEQWPCSAVNPPPPPSHLPAWGTTFSKPPPTSMGRGEAGRTLARCSAPSGAIFKHLGPPRLPHRPTGGGW